MNRLTAPTSAAAAREAVAFPAPPRRPGALRTALGRIRDFQPVDWAVYLVWVGVMAGLAGASGAFLAAGTRAGARFPAEAFFASCRAGTAATHTLAERGSRSPLRDRAQKKGLIDPTSPSGSVTRRNQASSLESLWSSSAISQTPCRVS
jgi:hypothetical protein